MGVCNLSEEIMLRSDDGQQIAVVARKNYPGLLANLLRRIPADQELIGAKIFTSTNGHTTISSSTYLSSSQLRNLSQLLQ